ncbi:adenosine receptor A2a-like [Amphiura filiformis]|uniref:adenosine receptor A2a-like n=1 Tax=Amphiura filiformis TaxID=82378 RepID=UPI003B226A40
MNVSFTYATFELFFAIMAVLGNGLVLLAFAKVERLLRSQTNYFILSLASADLLVGLLGVPFAILTSEGLPYNFRGCVIMLTFLLWLCGTSTFSLIGVTVDRFIAVSHPLSYQSIMTGRRAVIIIALSWVMSAIVGFLPVVGWNKGYPSTPGCFFMEIIDMKYMLFNAVVVIYIPLFVMIVLYGFIYRAVREQIRKIQPLGSISSGNSVNTVSGQEAKNSLKKRLSSYKRELRAVKAVAVIILVFMCCWLPLSLFNTITSICPFPKCRIPFELLNFFIIISHANSAINPWLYAYGRDFRVAYRRTLASLFPCCHINTDDIATTRYPGEGQSGEDSTNKS